MFTAAFWVAVFERAVKTFAQAFVAAIGTGATGLLDVHWQAALSVAGLATVLSVLTSIASAGAGSPRPFAGNRNGAQAVAVNAELKCPWHPPGVDVRGTFLC